MKNTKQIFFALSAVIFVLPLFLGAHIGDSDGEYGSPNSMMMYVEEGSIDTETYARMEALMEKMLDGTMNEEEADQMVLLMRENPGPYNMMMGRMRAQDYIMDGSNTGMWDSHMFGGSPGWSGWFWQAGMLIWFTLGALLLVMLVKKLINSK